MAYVIGAVVLGTAGLAGLSLQGPGDRDLPPRVSGTVTRSSFSIKGSELPSWAVTISIENRGSAPLTMGPLLAVVAATADPASHAAVCVIRELLPSEAAPARIRDRYGCDWGVDVPATGMGIWPLGALAPALNAVDRLLLTFSAPSLDPLDGGGYGAPVAPGETRTIAETVLFPLDIEIKGERTMLAVVPPILTAAGGEPVEQTLLRADLSGVAAVKQEITLTPIAVPLSGQALAGMAQAGQPPWQRVVAVNWLAERQPAAAAEILLQVAADGAAPPVVRHAALLNLGVLKVGGALSVLQGALDPASPRGMRMSALTAVGDLGDSRGAAAVRPFLTDSDAGVALRAIAAAAALEDSGSVPILTRILREHSEEELQAEAASALGAIAGPDALSALESTLRDGKAPLGARGGAALAAGRWRLESLVPAMHAVVTNDDESEAVRARAVRGLAMVGSTAALEALRAASNSSEESVRSSALDALASAADAASLEHVLQTARSPNARGRKEAIQVLGQGKRQEVLPIAAAVVADLRASEELRDAAVRALGALAVPEVVPALRPALDDRSRELYRAAVAALGGVTTPEVAPLLAAALRSRHDQVRAEAARALALQKLPETAALWAAYQREREDYAGAQMVSALIALGFSEPAAVPLLVRGLGPNRHPLWHEHTRLLQHLTKQEFGPASKYVSDQERNQALTAWQRWCQSAPACSGG
jgi:HEAT repeat protein